MANPLRTEHPHKNRHIPEKLENMIGVAMVAVIVVLGVFLIYGVLTTGSSTPAWMP